MSTPALVIVGIGRGGRRAAKEAWGFEPDAVLVDPSRLWDDDGAPSDRLPRSGAGYVLLIGRLDGTDGNELVKSALRLGKAGVRVVAVVTTPADDAKAEERGRRMESAGLDVIQVEAEPDEASVIVALTRTLRSMLADKGGTPPTRSKRSAPPTRSKRSAPPSRPTRVVRPPSPRAPSPADFGEGTFKMVPPPESEDDSPWESAPRSHPGEAANGGRAPSVDLVSFTVTYPALVIPGQTVLMDLWAHTEEHRDEVLRRAREEALDELRHGSGGGAPLARGTELEVELSLPELTVADARQPLAWYGAIANAGWFVDVPVDEKRGRIPGTITVRSGPLRIATVRFLVEVGQERPSAAAESEVRRIRRAFASYSSRDRDAVLGRVQGMVKALPELEVFVDVVVLRSGQDWARELERQMDDSDVLFLFWSDHARRSEWVEKEWRMGLSRRGLDFIDPVPLVPPDRAPPPDELASKHFNDLYLAFMKLEGEPKTP